ncbi:hypothetical protein B0H13DRAFT_2278715, partial [Mycena leptocephala]
TATTFRFLLVLRGTTFHLSVVSLVLIVIPNPLQPFVAHGITAPLFLLVAPDPLPNLSDAPVYPPAWQSFDPLPSSAALHF